MQEGVGSQMRGWIVRGLVILLRADSMACPWGHAIHGSIGQELGVVFLPCVLDFLEVPKRSLGRIWAEFRPDDQLGGLIIEYKASGLFILIIDSTQSFELQFSDEQKGR